MGTRTKQSHRNRQWWVAFLLTAVACIIASTELAFAAESAVPKEYRVKGAFLYNFTTFVEWPQACFPATNTPIRIGVFGKNPFGSELEEALRGRRVNGRPVVFQAVANAVEARTVHALFIPATEDSQTAEILRALKGSSVLTVGESPVFAAERGIINFVLEGDKVRFDIDMPAAKEAGLTISSHLQQLARTVRRKE